MAKSSVPPTRKKRRQSAGAGKKKTLPRKKSVTKVTMMVHDPKAKGRGGVHRIVAKKVAPLYGPRVSFFRKTREQYMNKSGFTKEQSLATMQIEFEIARMILLSPTPLSNVVRIYAVTNDHIDMQLLETREEEMEEHPEAVPSSVRKQVWRGLEQLHSLDVVMIDLHGGNIGYDSETKEWRIFDFDGSAIARPDKRGFRVPPAVPDIIFDGITRRCTDCGNKPLKTAVEKTYMEYCYLARHVSVDYYDNLAFYGMFRVFL